MATYKKYATKNNTPIQVQSAIEDGVGKNIQNNYAKQDGYYGKLTSGYANNLTPYSSESGTTQDIPFISQGTGCGNGSTQVDTGSYAQITAKKGTVVVANQLVNPSRIKSSGSGTGYSWSKTDDYVTIIVTETLASNKSIVLTDNVTSNYLPVPTGHKVWYSTHNASDKITLVNAYNGAGYSNQGIFTQPSSADNYILLSLQLASGLTAGTYVVRLKVVDLTLMYGNNAWIPSDLLSHPENFSRYYQGSLAYDTGSFVHANGRYLLTTGRNIWDEEWENGSIHATGVYNNVTCKNYISVIPNTTYYIHTSYSIVEKSVRLAWYDKDKNLIEVRNIYSNTATAPANAIYMKFSLHKSYGTTYKDDTTISIYYSGESGYDQYYPHEELDIIDTGTEDLLQAGEASDTKAKDGTITHNLVEINLAEKTWTLVEEAGYWYFVGSSPSNIRSVGSANLPNAHSDKYVTVKMNDAGLSNNTFAIDSQYILVRTSSTSVTPTGTIIAELDESTTEQGTPYESTLNINDFGTMYWLTSDNATPSVPQGIEIFYPVDYKAFVDSVYNHTDGDASNIALKGDLEAEDDKVDELYNIYKANMGGALRQQLATKETLDFLTATNWCDLGELTWAVDNAENHRFSTTIPADLVAGAYSTPAKMICTKYQVGSWDGTPNRNTNMTIVAYQSNIIICDTNFVGDASGVASLKDSLKGVLLAYEKA